MAIGSLIRILFQRLAAEQVQQTVADNLRRAAQRRSDPGASADEDGTNRTQDASSDDAETTAAPNRELLPCHVGLVVALPLESGYFEDRLAGVISIKGNGFTIRTGGLSGRGVAVAISGHGQTSARRAAEALIAGHHPRWIISAGFAGGLQPQQKRGDIVMADTVVGQQGERLSIDLRLPADERSQRSIHIGRLLTVDRIIYKSAEKRSLGQRYDAIAVDMESLAVAQVCQQQKQRFLAIRSITDTLDDELPRDIERLLNRPTMVRKLGSAAGSLLRRPSAAKDLWKLRESAIMAADRLAKFLVGVIQQLPD